SLVVMTTTRALIIIAVSVILFPNLSLCLACPQHESESLLSFKATTNVSNGVLSSWRNESDCCNWYGIECNKQKHVVMLSIDSALDNSATTLGGTLPSSLGKLSYLKELHLVSIALSAIIPPAICLLTRLTYLDLSYNQLNGSLPSCLGNLISLTYLYLDDNRLTGSIPPSLGNLSFLNKLFLSSNKLSGNIPCSLGNLSSATSLNLSLNQLNGRIPYSLGNLSLLVELEISHNHLSGALPSTFGMLSSLKWLFANDTAFNESFSSSVLPTSLFSLRLSLNHHLKISETFFHNLTGLLWLSLSNCVLNINPVWIPPFQLFFLELISCNINSQIPPWISNQFLRLETLTIANNSLVGQIPSWVWDISTSLYSVNLSANYLESLSLEKPSSGWTEVKVVDLSKNALSGKVPTVWPKLGVLLLNDNLFTGNIPPSWGNFFDLQMLNLANNSLTGTIPPTIANCSSLKILNLGNNYFEGYLPFEFGKLSLYSLVIHNNNLSGSFLPPIVNCTELQILDIGHNAFQGRISKSIGNMTKLRVLVMKGNNFRGRIPSQIEKLKYLQILDLSFNHLSSFIPRSILSLQAMAITVQQASVLSYDELRVFIDYFETGINQVFYSAGLDLTAKSRQEFYPYILSTLTSIDLSHNELNGRVPSDFGKLKGLMFLNLSTNHLSGTIPHSLGEMVQLESLDLSTNKFSGKIPQELNSLDSLGVLNLSTNNLSGSIPQGGHMTTFEESSYSGNPNLWNCPLPKNCSWPEFAPRLFSNNTEEKSREIPWFEITVGLLYGGGLGGVIALLVIVERWRMKYFEAVDFILKIVFPSFRNLTL
ncbi:hypothetical protein KI387_032456, partial [Taxus chinensis]